MYSVYKIDTIVPLPNDKYFDYLDAKIAASNKRIWISMFIINIIVKHDVNLAIRHLLNQLKIAQWKNVDVKILIGSSATKGIRIANSTSLQFMQAQGINVKEFLGVKNRSLHSKYVIIDDDCIVLGSHNWTPNAMANNNEDSIAIRSNDLNKILSDEFHDRWLESQ